MRLIKASTKDVYFKVDDDDYEELSKFKWYVHISRSGTPPYAKRVVYVRRGGKDTSISVMMHRQITDAPKGMDVDHINHDTLDNQRANLRVCTHTRNVHNRRAANVGARSKYIGVGWSECRQAWIATLRNKYLGLGRGPEGEIAMAHLRDQAAVREWGDMAVLNYPNGRNAVVEA